MKIDYDQNKSDKNIKERNISFEQVNNFDFHTAIYEIDNRKDYGEIRIKSCGKINGRLHTLIYTERKDTIRIISLRKSNKKEVREYQKQLNIEDKNNNLSNSELTNEFKNFLAKYEINLENIIENKKVKFCINDKEKNKQDLEYYLHNINGNFYGYLKNHYLGKTYLFRYSNINNLKQNIPINDTHKNTAKLSNEVSLNYKDHLETLKELSYLKNQSEIRLEVFAQYRALIIADAQARNMSNELINEKITNFDELLKQNNFCDNIYNLYLNNKKEIEIEIKTDEIQNKIEQKDKSLSL